MTSSVPLLLLLVGLLGVAQSCSCYRRRYNAEVCDERVKYIIKVKITEYLSEDKPDAFEQEEELGDLTAPTSMTTSTSTYAYYSRTRRVRAKILHFYKGKGEVGSDIILSSGMMDSMCGIGSWLIPGEKFALSTDNLEETSMGLCSFNFMVGGWEWPAVEPVLKNHDCDCKIQECRLRENRKVLRGMCKDTAAYCARDIKGKCRWYNVESIDACTINPYVRRRN